MAGAALFVWTNVPAAIERDFNAWYDREHLIERVEIAGFVRARRFEALSAPRKYLTIYETREIGVFTSPAYLRSVNNPRPSTQAIVKQFRDTARVIGHVRRRAGCDGAILALAALLPEACARMRALVRDDRVAEARALQHWIMPLARSVGGTYGVAGFKAALDLSGYKGGMPRPPLRPASAQVVETIRGQLAALGAFKDLFVEIS